MLDPYTIWSWLVGPQGLVITSLFCLAMLLVVSQAAAELRENLARATEGGRDAGLDLISWPWRMVSGIFRRVLGRRG